MNNALDSPLEALAIDYLSFGFLTAVNNIWTWVAVIAGAVSFFLTIRKPTKSITGSVQPDPKIPDPVQTTYPPATLPDGWVDSRHDGFQGLTLEKNSSQTIISTLMHQIPSAEQFEPTTSRRVPDSCRLSTSKYSSIFLSQTMEGTTRRKFTVYYEDDVADEREDEAMDVCHVAERECDRWELEAILRTRILSGEEMGWYHYQDLTVIDGNVVRLWDECRAV